MKKAMFKFEEMVELIQDYVLTVSCTLFVIGAVELFTSNDLTVTMATGLVMGGIFAGLIIILLPISTIFEMRRFSKKSKAEDDN